MIHKIAVRNEAQRILYESLQGQFSDGFWENSNMPWEDWASADVVVDPENVGVEGWAYRYYNLTNPTLLSYIEGDLIHEVIHGSWRDDEGGTGDESYDHKRLMKDLNDLKKIQKIQRDTSLPEPTPAKVALAAKTEADTRVAQAKAALEAAIKAAAKSHIAYAEAVYAETVAVA